METQEKKTVDMNTVLRLSNTALAEFAAMLLNDMVHEASSLHDNTLGYINDVDVMDGTGLASLVDSMDQIAQTRTIVTAIANRIANRIRIDGEESAACAIDQALKKIGQDGAQ